MNTGWYILLAVLLGGLAIVLAGSYLLNLYFNMKYKFFGKVVSNTAKMIETYTKEKEANKNGDKKDI